MPLAPYPNTGKSDKEVHAMRMRREFKKIHIHQLLVVF